MKLEDVEVGQVVKQVGNKTLMTVEKVEVRVGTIWFDVNDNFHRDYYDLDEIEFPPNSNTAPEHVTVTLNK